MRRAALQRRTRETQISGTLKIEGRGRYRISTGIRFFDHMLELFAKHGGFDLELCARCGWSGIFKVNWWRISLADS